MNKNKRLFPDWYSEHYYGQTQLRKSINTVIEKHLLKFKNEKAKILDYGCGTKPYKELYEKYIPNYFGADILLNPNRDYDLDIKTSSIAVEDNKFEVIISTQVLEHVISPKDYLSEASRVCKPNGLLIISTHGFFPFHPDPNDYWRWTASGLKKELSNNNWETVECVGIIGYTGAALSLLQYSLSNKFPRVFKIIFEIIMQRIIWFVDSFASIQSRQENAVIYLIVAKNIK